MVRFLHTADWQLGMKAARLGEAAETVRNARFETIRGMLEMAESAGVDFAIVAGDIFENNGVSEDIVRSTIGVLEEAEGFPIFILPGNHDPMTADSVYRRKLWDRTVPEKVKVLGSPESLSILDDKVILYPCPIGQKISRLDPTTWIPEEKVDAIRIGVAHAPSTRVRRGKGPTFPSTPSAPPPPVSTTSPSGIGTPSSSTMTGGPSIPARPNPPLSGRETAATR